MVGGARFFLGRTRMCWGSGGGERYFAVFLVRGGLSDSGLDGFLRG